MYHSFPSFNEKARRSDVEFERYVDDIFGDVVNLG